MSDEAERGKARPQRAYTPRNFSKLNREWREKFSSALECLIASLEPLLLYTKAIRRDGQGGISVSLLDAGSLLVTTASDSLHKADRCASLPVDAHPHDFYAVVHYQNLMSELMRRWGIGARLEKEGLVEWRCPDYPRDFFRNPKYSFGEAEVEVFRQILASLRMAEADMVSTSAADEPEALLAVQAVHKARDVKSTIEPLLDEAEDQPRSHALADSEAAVNPEIAKWGNGKPTQSPEEIRKERNRWCLNFVERLAS